MERYHLIICDPNRSAILAKKMSSGLLLPTCVASRRLRPAFVIRGALQQLGLTCPIVCILAGTCDTDHREVNWTALVDGRRVVDYGAPGLSWVHVDSGLTASWLLSYQQTAFNVSTIAAPANDRAGPFARIGWMERVSQWVSSSLPSSCRRTEEDPLIYRATPTQVVVRFATTMGPFYFKAHARGEFFEPYMTEELAGQFPEHFARTLGFDANLGWWLTASVAGRPLLESSDPLEWRCAGRTLAHTQLASVPTVPHLEKLGIPIVSPRHLLHWSMDVLRRAAKSHVSLRKTQIRMLEARLSLIVERLMGPELPAVWTHTDPAPDNVFSHASGAAFIDLAEPVLAPPVLTVGAFLVSAAEHRLSAELRRSFLAGYIGLWREAHPLVSGCEQDLLMLGYLFEAWQLHQRIEEARTSGEIISSDRVGRRTVASRLLRRLSVMDDLPMQRVVTSPGVLRKLGSGS
jgi:hypothetical protein